jgi:hypothetical protein
MVNKNIVIRQSNARVNIEKIGQRSFPTVRFPASCKRRAAKPAPGFSRVNRRATQTTPVERGRSLLPSFTGINPGAGFKNPPEVKANELQHPPSIPDAQFPNCAIPGNPDFRMLRFSDFQIFRFSDSQIIRLLDSQIIRLLDY